MPVKGPRPIFGKKQTPAAVNESPSLKQPITSAPPSKEEINISVPDQAQKIEVIPVTGNGRSRKIIHSSKHEKVDEVKSENTPRTLSNKEI